MTHASSVNDVPLPIRLVQGGSHAYHVGKTWPQDVERIGDIQNEAGGDGVTLVKDCQRVRQCGVLNHASTP